jgi:hypothetical protein
MAGEWDRPIILKETLVWLELDRVLRVQLIYFVGVCLHLEVSLIGLQCFNDIVCEPFAFCLMMHPLLNLNIMQDVEPCLPACPNVCNCQDGWNMFCTIRRNN